MKIAVPWPDPSCDRDRVKEALALWENKGTLVICVLKDKDDDFLDNYDCVTLKGVLSETETEGPGIYILDMLRAIRKAYQDEDWYGCSNSEIVLSGNPVEALEEYETLIFHRTNIEEWDDRFAEVDHYRYVVGRKNIHRWIWEQREAGINDKEIALTLNGQNIKPPYGPEWKDVTIQNVFKKQGKIFIWGQDMFMFRKDVIDRVLEYEEVPIIGSNTGDVCLSRWLFDNFKAKRVFSRIFRKNHTSESSHDTPDRFHSGGIFNKNRKFYLYDDEPLLELPERQKTHVLPQRFKEYIRTLRWTPKNWTA